MFIYIKEFLVLILLGIKNSNSNCVVEPIFKWDDYNTIFIKIYQKFNNDLINGKGINLTCLNNISNYLIQYIDFNFDKKYYLGNNFWFTQFTKVPLNLSLFDYYHKFIEFELKNLNGFLLNQESIFNVYKYSYLYTKVLANFYDTTFKTKGLCDYKNNDDKSGLFNNIDELNFAYTVKYTFNNCPLIFKNTNISILRFYGLSYNFIKKNIYSFSNLNFSINSNIMELSLTFYNTNFNKDLLNEYLFEKLKYININGLVTKFDSNLFENLKNLILINIQLNDYRYFFNHDSKWLNSINKNLNVNLTNQYAIDLNSDRICFVFFNIKFVSELFYLFLDEDICLFKGFPHNQLVYPVFSVYSFLNCSCTFLWMIKYTYQLYPYLNKTEDRINFLSYDYEPCGSKENFIESIEKCNFNKRFSLCTDTLFHSNKYKKLLTQLDILYTLEIIDFFIIILYPLVCFIGMVSNLVNMKVLIDRKKILKDNKNKNKNIRMRRSMFINSCFNLVYLLIRLIHLINLCVTRNGIFCSSINREYYAQILDIYLVNLIGNLLKIFSNLTTISISLNRYILLNPNFDFKFQKFKEKKLLNFLLKIIFILFLVSFAVEKVFNNSINLNYQVKDDLYMYMQYPDTNFILTFITTRIRLNQILKNTIIILYILNFFLNDILFLILFSAIEILILLKAKSELKKKIKINNSLRPNDKLKNLKAEKSNKKLTFLILINSSVNLIFRSLDFSISSFVVSKRLDQNQHDSNICYRYSKICSILENFNELFFSISISYYTITYYYLNWDFRTVIKSYFSKNINAKPSHNNFS